MKLKTSVLTFFLVLFCSTALASSLSNNTNGCPLPSDLSIIKPLDNIPSSLAAYSGIWVGSTSTQMGVVIVFEKIEKTFGLTKIYTLVSWNNRYLNEGWSKQLAYYDPDSKSVWLDVATIPLPKFQIELNPPSGDSMDGKYSGTYRGNLHFSKKQ
jgi:hypothetical protein